jgi:hypothetical protein
MIKQLLYKWFGLSDAPCETCELLREQLHKSDAERRELLHRLLDPQKAEPPPIQSEEHIPITPQYTPWRVRQQMLEAEDRQKAKILHARAEDIDKLEKELGINDASQIS